MRRGSILPIWIAAALMAPAAAAGPTASERLNKVFEERLAWELDEFPEVAMSRGDYTNADRVTDASLEAIERRHRDTERCLIQLELVPYDDLDRDDQLNYDLFELRLRNQLDGYRFRMFLAPLGGRYGLHQDIPQMGERVRFRDETDYVNYLKRLEQVPDMVVDTIVRLQTGANEGRTPPRVTLEGLPGQFDAILAPGGGLEALREPFDRVPKQVSNQQRRELEERFEKKVMPSVRDAVRQFQTYVVHDYLPACRETIAARDLPDGEAFYAYQLRVMTTTDLSAAEIHEIGLSEVVRIREEMMKVIRSSDFMERYNGTPDAGDDEQLFKAFLEYLRTDPRFYYTREEDLLTGYRDICKRVDAQLPKLFGTLPRLPYGVKKIPDFMAPNQTTAYYQRGDMANAEAGYFFANTYALDQRPRYEMIPLALHESVPGHHLQIALAQELEGLPDFRLRWGFTAFGEGWALYAERLGIEMGFYESPYDDFGRLLYEMWRACRLVVDPGMHALGWSRQQAIDFMLANTALSQLNIETEVDRYITWPGQACAYKIGELKIRDLRELAERRLGSRFDLRAFHDQVLGAGSIPLNVLEDRIEFWINSQQIRPYD